MQTIFNVLFALTGEQYLTVSGVVWMLHVTLAFISYTLFCIKYPTKYDKKERSDALELFMMRVVLSVVASAFFPLSIAIYIVIAIAYALQWAARGFGNYIADKYDPYKENYK